VAGGREAGREVVTKRRDTSSTLTIILRTADGQRVSLIMLQALRANAHVAPVSTCKKHPRYGNK